MAGFSALLCESWSTAHPRPVYGSARRVLRQLRSRRDLSSHFALTRLPAVRDALSPSRHFALCFHNLSWSFTCPNTICGALWIPNRLYSKIWGTSRIKMLTFIVSRLVMRFTQCFIYIYVYVFTPVICKQLFCWHAKIYTVCTAETTFILLFYI